MENLSQRATYLINNARHRESTIVMGSKNFINSRYATEIGIQIMDDLG